MRGLSLARQLIDTLPVSEPLLFNPWRQVSPMDHAAAPCEDRVARLGNHLDCEAGLVLIGEAPGYQGCRYSGIAFTSERLLLEGAIPRVKAPAERLTTRVLPFSEPSATIVWKTLYLHGLAEKTVLWNAVQLHPFKAGNPWSNRTPTDNELAFGVPALTILREAFPGAMFVAVGQKAAGVLEGMGVRADATVRHPANGGATKFAAGIAELAKNISR